MHRSSGGRVGGEGGGGSIMHRSRGGMGSTIYTQIFASSLNSQGMGFELTKLCRTTPGRQRTGTGPLS